VGVAEALSPKCWSDNPPGNGGRNAESDFHGGAQLIRKFLTIGTFNEFLRAAGRDISIPMHHQPSPMQIVVQSLAQPLL
jgi:hypothetical protein